MFMSEKQYRRRLCDRSDGRLLKKLSPMHRIEPYIMVHRNDSTILSLIRLRSLSWRSISDSKGNRDTRALECFML